MSLQILGEINKNYLTALRVHDELSQVFEFIGLQGYSLWHFYQYLEESCTQRKIKAYITDTYGVYCVDEAPPNVNIGEPLLKGKTRKGLKIETSWDIVKKAFAAYCAFEEKNLQLYQQKALQAFQNGDISVFNFISDLVRDVKNELTYLNGKMAELASYNYEMAQISAEQDTYYERYTHLIGTLFKPKEQYHHYNSAVSKLDDV